MRRGRRRAATTFAVLIAALFSGPVAQAAGERTERVSESIPWHVASASVSADGRFAAFISNDPRLDPLDRNGLDDVFVHDTTTGYIERVSVDAGGDDADGPATEATISDDGTLIVFASQATDLVASGDHNDASDVFVRRLCMDDIGDDTCVPSTTLVSARPDLRAGNGASIEPAIGPCGTGGKRCVVFSSLASDLLGEDTGDAFRDVFIRTVTDAGDGLTLGLMQQVSVATGTGSGGDSGAPAITTEFFLTPAVTPPPKARLPDAYVAFASDAADLVPGDTRGFRDVFVRGVCLREDCDETIERLSVTYDGGEADGPSGNPTIADRAIAFETDATNLMEEAPLDLDDPVAPCRVAKCDTNGVTDILLLTERPGDWPDRVRVKSSWPARNDRTNQPDGRSFDPALAPDGRLLVFTSEATNLEAPDKEQLSAGHPSAPNGVADVFVFRKLGQPMRVSSGALGVEADAASSAPFIAGASTIAGSSRLAFISRASNLVGGDRNGGPDAFTRSITAQDTLGPVARVSVPSQAREEPDASAAEPSVDQAGTRIAFTSEATNLSRGGNGHRQVYLRDLRSFETRLISSGPAGVAGNADSSQPAISHDGRFLAFTSAATNLTATTGPSGCVGSLVCTQVYVHEIETGVTTLVSASTDGRAGNGASDEPDIASMIPSSTLQQPDVGRGSGTIRTGIVDTATEPLLLVTFSSYADNLLRCIDASPDNQARELAKAACDRNGSRDVFVRDVFDGVTVRVSTEIDGLERVGDSSQPSISRGIPLSTRLGTTGAVTGGFRVAFASTAPFASDGWCPAGNTSQPCAETKTRHVYVRDLASITCIETAAGSVVDVCPAGQLMRASVKAGGLVIPDTSGEHWAPSISPDAREVAFVSSGFELVRPPDVDGDNVCDEPGCDRAGKDDIYVHDLEDRRTYRASVGPYGADASGRSSGPVMGDGSVVAFTSDATNLVPEHDGNDATDVFVRAVREGVTMRTSVSRDGLEATGPSHSAAGLLRTTDDRLQLAFVTAATNVADVTIDRTGICRAACDDGIDDDVVLMDIDGSRRRISVVAVDEDPGDANGSSAGRPAVTVVKRDGTTSEFVAFTSAADDLVASDANGTTDVFLRERTCGTASVCARRLSLVSARSDGAPANADSAQPAISEDGDSVAFASMATDIDGGNISTQDIFVRRMRARVSELVSVPISGDRADGDSQTPSISGDGRFVAFASIADNLDPMEGGGRSNSQYDVFLRDTCPTGKGCLGTMRVSVQRSRNDQTPRVALGASSAPSVSRDGRFVAFISTADLTGTPGTRGASAQAFVWDRTTRLVRRVSEASPMQTGAGRPVTQVAISPDGAWVAFTTAATTFGVLDGVPQVYRTTTCADQPSCMVTPVVMSVDHDRDLPGGVLDHQPVAISQDGREVVFVSTAALVREDAPAGTPAGFADIYVRLVHTGATMRASATNLLPEVGGDAGSYRPAISSDGRAIAFMTTATNLLLPRLDENRACDNDGDERPFENCTDIYIRSSVG